MDDNLILQPIDEDNSPTRADAVQNRATLLKTARRLFNEQGVDDVSMTQIAKEAEVGKGTLYRHFANKVELCQALLDEHQRDLQARTFEYLRQDCDVRTKLEWFLSEVVAYVYGNLNLLGAREGVFGASHLSHPAHWWWRNTIEGLLKQAGITEKRSYMTDVLYVMLDAVTIDFQSSTLGYSDDDIINGLKATLDRLLP